MTQQELALGTLLSRIADELNITQTMQEKAIKSYTAVGQWLGDGIPYDVKIMPQGSMNLGTVIRPIDDRDDYDMDVVCLLRNGQKLSLLEIKNMVGNRLKEHKLYNHLLEKEGKQCWTMQYEEFHMDILPCVPRLEYFIEPYITDIKLTHKIADGYYEERFSNPYAYHIWFEKRMMDILMIQKREFAAKNQVEIDKVPTYKMRTPLQKVIQLLKRHRDICFQSNPDVAPISIIITTLAAQAYGGETDVYEALRNVLVKMPEHINCRNGVYWVENPVMKEENFADKWALEPIKRDAFFKWVNRAQKELATDPLSCYGINTVAEHYKHLLGQAPVERAVNSLGNDVLTARKNGNLYISGLGGGLNVSQQKVDKQVKEHTFFGK